MNQDFRDLLCEFNAQQVEYLIVGAHALAVHGHVRATKDLDVWVRPEPRNAERVLRALHSFGAPITNLSVADLVGSDLIFQIGIAPVRIDVITSVTGVEFEDAWKRRVSSRFADQIVGVLSKEDLIANKRAAGRSQDLADIERLEGKDPGNR